MFIAGLGTALPPRRFTQQECWQAFEGSPVLETLTPRSRGLLKKILRGSNGIVSRHFALQSIEEAFQNSPDILHQRFAREAPKLATEAGARALADAGCSRHEIDAVIVSTCTGYLCPGLTSYLIESLGLPKTVFALDLVGQGCAAALPNLRTAQHLLASGGHRRVLSVCVEICSAAFYLDDDPGVLISACLFGDGAGAAVLSREPGKRAVEWMASGSLTFPEDRDLLRFEQRSGMLRNILSPEVPKLAAARVEEVLGEVLAKRGLMISDIAAWILHAGGRDVLVAIRERLGLPESATALSAAVLRDCGNLSSPFVYFVLEKALREVQGPGYWWLSSFGAGFSCHGALLKVR